MFREALSSREETESLRTAVLPGVAGEVLSALSDPAVSLLPLWLSPEDGFRFDSIGDGIASAAAMAAAPGALLDIYNLLERTDFNLSVCDLICAIDLLDELPPLLEDSSSREILATLLANNGELSEWFFNLEKAPSDRILRLDPQAWPILEDFDHEGLSQWKQLSDLSPQVWTAIRRFNFDDYGRQVLEAIGSGDTNTLKGLTSWNVSTLHCVLAGLVMLTDAVADQLEGGLLDSAALASFLSESEREHYAESLSQPLRDLQSGLLQLGPVLPNQLVAQLQQLVDNTINNELGLEGADRVDVRGTIPDIENLPASPTTYWLELDFSGLSTSVSLPLPIDSLVSSALGVTLDDLPELSANLTAELQGGLRFGIDLATTVPSQALLLDTNGDLEAFDGTRAELLADFSADLSSIQRASPIGWRASTSQNSCALRVMPISIW